MARTLRWVNPTQREDGTAYAQAENAGYEIQVDGTGAVSIPVAWATEFDLETLALWPTLKHGQHNAALAVVDKGGLKSAFSSAATFPVSVRPLAPKSLAFA